MSGLSVSDALRSFISTPVHEAGAEPSDFAQEEKRPLIVNIRGTAHVYSCYVRGCDAVAVSVASGPQAAVRARADGRRYVVGLVCAGELARTAKWI